METKNAVTPYEEFGIECGEGWKSLYQPIIDWISQYNDSHKNDPDFDKIEIIQIKEKFGSLRIYLRHAPEELSKMIEKAEKESCSVCEYCGSRENVGVTYGWITHVCRSCMEKMHNGHVVRWIGPDRIKLHFLDGKVVSSEK